MLYNAWPVIITALLHALLCLSTYRTTQTGTHTHSIYARPHTHTHTLHLVLTVIYSILALSPPVLSVCSHSHSHPDDWEGKTEKKAESGWGGETESERRRKGKLREWGEHLFRGLCICMIIHMSFMCGRVPCTSLLENSRLSRTETLCGRSSLASVWARVAPRDLACALTFLAAPFLLVHLESREALVTSWQDVRGIITLIVSQSHPWANTDLHVFACQACHPLTEQKGSQRVASSGVVSAVYTRHVHLKYPLLWY